jgi:hypothetical protein
MQNTLVALKRQIHQNPVALADSGILEMCHAL